MALDDAAPPSEQWPRTSSVTLAAGVAARAVCFLVQGTPRGPTTHRRVGRVVAAMPDEISDILLGASKRRRGGLLICIIKEQDLGFFSCQDSCSA
jgi:hypothetical protein